VLQRAEAGMTVHVYGLHPCTLVDLP
jgi:hypothetical protein